MSIALLLPSIANAISEMTISGVTIKNYTELSGSWKGQANILYPNADPPGWITDFGIEYASLLEGADAPADISYTLNYRFLSVEIGDLSNFPKAYTDLVDKVALIVAAIIALDSPYSGKVHMQIGNIAVGPRNDLAGNRYHGADIPVRITEMQN